MKFKIDIDDLMTIIANANNHEKVEVRPYGDLGCVIEFSNDEVVDPIVITLERIPECV